MFKKVFPAVILSLFVLSFAAVGFASGTAEDTNTVEGVIVEIDQSDENASIVLKDASGNDAVFSVGEGVAIENIAVGDRVSVQYFPGDRTIKSISKLSG